MKQNHLRLALVGAMLFSATTGLQAQAIYRSVDHFGRITFSDHPVAQTPVERTETSPVGQAPSAPSNELPYALNQAMSRYPVTLYTGPNCAPCDAGRAALVQRGVPFSEKTVTTNSDIEAYLRVGGDSSLPMLTIGQQRMRGFSDSDWNLYLTAAGYPATSQLPASYRAAPATAMAPVEIAPAAQARTESSLPPIAPTPAGPSPGNPSGIQF